MDIHKQFRKASIWVVSLTVLGWSGLGAGQSTIYEFELYEATNRAIIKLKTLENSSGTTIGGSVEHTQQTFQLGANNGFDGVGTLLATKHASGYYTEGVWAGRDGSNVKDAFERAAPTLAFNEIGAISGTVWPIEHAAIAIRPDGYLFLGVKKQFETEFGSWDQDDEIYGEDVLVGSIVDFVAFADWFKDHCAYLKTFDADNIPVEIYFGPYRSTDDICRMNKFKSVIPGTSSFSAPSLANVVAANKGFKSSNNFVSSGFAPLGNVGFTPFGNGLMIGVGYDGADNSVSGDDVSNFDGNGYRIYMELVTGHNNLFYGLAGEYRESKYTLADLTTKYKTKYYGPRVDLGWVYEQDGSSKGAVNKDYAYIQLSGGYLWGKAKLDGVSGQTGYLIPSSLIVGANKRYKRLALQPEANLQWTWQKLGTIGADTFKNRNYGRADFNLGLEALLQRGWFITPNAGYRWDIRTVCSGVVGGAADICVPKASGIRYGIKAGKVGAAGGGFIDQLALSAYYDYFKKSGVKQTQWGVMALYPF